MIVFESDPGSIAADTHHASDALARFGTGSLVVACRDSRPQFGKDDVDVIRFASIRFDHALDEDDRSAVLRALASRTTSIPSWLTVAHRTYAIVRYEGSFSASFARDFEATVDEPAVLLFRVRSVHLPRLAELARILTGAGRPKSIRNGSLCAEDIIVELDPTGKAIALLLALIDATLVATPGRTVEPLLPISDDVLAEYASLRLGDSLIDVSRVLDPYVETLIEATASVA